jgi:Mn-dependent DtxR family transcriptional regulator
MKHGVISQTLVNVLAKDPDIKEIGKDQVAHSVSGSYEERIWTLTQHVEMVPALHVRLGRRKGFNRMADGKWALPEWES